MKIVSFDNTFPLFEYKLIKCIWWFPRTKYNSRFENNLIGSKYFAKIYNIFMYDADETNICFRSLYQIINVQINRDIQEWIIHSKNEYID